tara:strand:+ start:1543 stop:2292 length:750 start_codon:yes stop_codon:yes gene_type:complete
MNRRQSIKRLILGTLSAGLFFPSAVEAKKHRGFSVSPADPNQPFTRAPYTEREWDYGRTPEEKERDELLFNQRFFDAHELSTIEVLCDHILPASDTAGSAIDAGVIEFIAFIVLDMPSLQTRLRGGIMWLDSFSRKHHGDVFVRISVLNQVQVLDKIAYPNKITGATQQGGRFFNEIRNLILTGYYTSEIGVKDLGFQGNSANVWDGVPPEVLAEHSVDYEPEWLAKCVNQDRRTEIAEWDQEGNLLNN